MMATIFPALQRTTIEQFTVQEPYVPLNEFWEPSSTSFNFNDYLASKFWEWRLGLFLWKYIPPFLIIFGTTFNALTILVLHLRKFGNSSTRAFLVSLALVDTAVLLTGLLRHWIQKVFELDVRSLMLVSCPLHRFLTYLFIHLASWIVTLLTIERWISVSYPLKARVVCTRRYTYITLSTLTIFLIVLNSHSLFFMRLNRNLQINCYFISDEYKDFFLKTWFWIDMCAYSALPFLIIAYCNCSILFQVIQGQVARKKLQNPGVRSDGHSAQLTNMTRMLTTNSVAFILLTLPSSVYYISNGGRMVTGWKEYVQYHLFFTVTSLLAYLNNAINFLLYCVSGAQFRREVFRMFRCRRGVEAS